MPPEIQRNSITLKIKNPNRFLKVRLGFRLKYKTMRYLVTASFISAAFSDTASAA